jgi:hypothetical protein
MRPLDEQQARLVERLRAAGGAPVSFEQLRSEGIENPAQLCYELELAGLRITRVQRREAGGQAFPVGIRLDEPDTDELPLGLGASAPQGRSGRADSKRACAGDPRAAPARAHKRRDLSRAAVKPLERGVRGLVHVQSVRARALAGLLVAAAALGATIGLSEHSSRPRASLATTHNRERATPSRGPPRYRRRAALGTPGGLTQPAKPGARGRARRAPSAERAQTRISPAAATRLQLTGHQLLAQGRYAAASSDLRAALAASGESVTGCLEPASQACLTYAYALYDLGRALRLAGNPAAVQILGERLKIDNQRPTVRYELELARQHLHTARSTRPSGSAPPGRLRASAK